MEYHPSMSLENTSLMEIYSNNDLDDHYPIQESLILRKELWTSLEELLQGLKEMKQATTTHDKEIMETSLQLIKKNKEVVEKEKTKRLIHLSLLREKKVYSDKLKCIQQNCEERKATSKDNDPLNEAILEALRAIQLK